jgi:hypothetical protein
MASKYHTATGLHKSMAYWPYNKSHWVRLRKVKLQQWRISRLRGSASHDHQMRFSAIALANKKTNEFYHAQYDDNGGECHDHGMKGSVGMF